MLNQAFGTSHGEHQGWTVLRICEHELSGGIRQKAKGRRQKMVEQIRKALERSSRPTLTGWRKGAANFTNGRECKANRQDASDAEKRGERVRDARPIPSL
jgi:hypothetical protein